MSPGYGPGKPQGLGPDDGDDAAFARIDVQHPEIEKGYLREHRKRRGEAERADPAGLYPVSRSAFSGELGWRCGTPESRWSLCRDTRSSPCMSAMTACPPFPSSNTRLFTMSCSHSPSCRAASFVPPRSTKRYSKRPTSSPASSRIRMAGASPFPCIPLLQVRRTGRRYLISRLLSTALVDCCRFRFSPLMPADVSLIPG